MYRENPSTLKHLPFAPSSRAALVQRCQLMLQRPPCNMPRSGPWAHEVTNPKQVLPPCLGRTQHRDVWHVNEPEPSSLGYVLSHEEWESWHLRHSEQQRKTNSGMSWRAPTPLRVGNIYLPQIHSHAASGATSRASWYSNKSSALAARQGARDALAARQHLLRFAALPNPPPPPRSTTSQDLDDL
jgi:hypothetical protein